MRQVRRGETSPLAPEASVHVKDVGSWLRANQGTSARKTRGERVKTDRVTNTSFSTHTPPLICNTQSFGGLKPGINTVLLTSDLHALPAILLRKSSPRSSVSEMTHSELLPKTSRDKDSVRARWLTPRDLCGCTSHWGYRLFLASPAGRCTTIRISAAFRSC